MVTLAVRRFVWPLRLAAVALALTVALAFNAHFAGAANAAKKALATPTPAVLSMLPQTAVPGQVSAQGLSIFCGIGITSLGIGAISAFFFPPSGIAWLLFYAVYALDTVTTGAECLKGGQEQHQPGIGCFTPANYKSTSSDGSTKYYYPVRHGISDNGKVIPSCINSPWDL